MLLTLLQFLLSIVIFLVIYILPTIGLVFTQNHHKRWLGHWLVTLFAVNLLLPTLNILLPKFVVQLISIFLGVYRLLKFRNEKSLALFAKIDPYIQLAGDFVTQIIDQLQNIVQAYI